LPFAVSCDYIDVKDKGFWESFKATGNGGTFEMKPYWQNIHPKLSEKAKAEMIKSVTLYLVGGTSKPISAAVKSSGGVIKIDFQGTLKKKLDKDYSNGAIFLSIKFNGTAFNGLPGFNHYDFNSPWNIQVGIYSNGHDLFENPEDSLQPGYEKDVIALAILAKKRQILERRRTNMGSWEIMRHKKDGEIPSFIARVGLNSFEYDNNLDMPK
jgi:hypothetical protein